MAARSASPEIASTRVSVSRIRETLASIAPCSSSPTPAQWEATRRKLAEEESPWAHCVKGKEHESAIAEAKEELMAEGIVLHQQAEMWAKHCLGKLCNADFNKQRTHARNSLLSHHAAMAAIHKLIAEGVEVSANRFETALRAALTAADAGVEVTDMIDRACTVLKNEKKTPETLIATMLTYRTEGVDLLVSWSTLAGTVYEARLRRSCLVSDLAHEVYKTKFGRAEASVSIDGFDQSFTALQCVRASSDASAPTRVAIIGPQGTCLDSGMPLQGALDSESEPPASDDDKCEFYSLEVLTGQAWRDLGLHGATRWQYLREAEFRKIFGMSKSRFQELPSWKQVPLKKKQNLF